LELRHPLSVLIARRQGTVHLQLHRCAWNRRQTFLPYYLAGREAQGCLRLLELRLEGVNLRRAFALPGILEIRKGLT